MKLDGIIPAIVTPFDRNGDVNYTELKKLVELLLEEGADGFYVTGSTGECFLLTDEERTLVTAAVAETVNGKVPVIAHIGKIGASQAANLAREAQRAGASAVSSVPPFYYNFQTDEIAGYYECISNATDLPVVIYNIPQFSGVSINADNMASIMGNSRVEGLKYTDLNLYELERIRRKFPQLKIMFGKDESLLYALPVGVDGAIGSTYNFTLKLFRKIWNAYRQEQFREAEKFQHEENKIISEMLRIKNIIAAEKYLLGKKGIQCGNCRPPFRPLTEEEKHILDGIGDMD